MAMSRGCWAVGDLRFEFENLVKYARTPWSESSWISIEFRGVRCDEWLGSSPVFIDRRGDGASNPLSNLSAFNIRSAGKAGDALLFLKRLVSEGGVFGGFVFKGVNPIVHCGWPEPNGAAAGRSSISSVMPERRNLSSFKRIA